MDVPSAIRREIANIEDKIEDRKRALKSCLDDNTQTWTITQELRAFHTRLAELHKNLRKVRPER